MDIDNLFTSYIGRVVTFVFYPILAVAVPPVVTVVNNVLDTGLTEGQVTQAAIATIVGSAILFYKWLDNRGTQEVQALATKMQETYELGDEHLSGTAPTVRDK